MQDCGLVRILGVDFPMIARGDPYEYSIDTVSLASVLGEDIRTLKHIRKKHSGRFSDPSVLDGRERCWTEADIIQLIPLLEGTVSTNMRELLVDKVLHAASVSTPR